MKSLLFATAPLILLAACADDNGSDFTERIVPVGDYAVYDALIEEHFACSDFQMFVITDSTGSEMIDESFPVDTVAARYGLHIPAEIASDFMKNNRQAFRLDTLFDLKVRCKIITTREINAIFGRQCAEGWDSFYRQYPNSQGTMTLSRIGYNAEMNMALLTMGNQNQCESGLGFIVLMVRENGVWKIRSKINYWIS